MSDVTCILNALERGDAKATDELLPLVYEELRILAAQKLSHESPGQTLQATALVHEAYLRLVGSEPQTWENHGHFFTVDLRLYGMAGNRLEKTSPILYNCTCLEKSPPQRGGKYPRCMQGFS